jgi:hypothetical protein
MSRPVNSSTMTTSPSLIMYSTSFLKRTWARSPWLMEWSVSMFAGSYRLPTLRSFSACAMPALGEGDRARLLVDDVVARLFELLALFDRLMSRERGAGDEPRMILSMA